MYGWAQPLQDELSKQLLPVAQAAGAGIEVLVDLQNTTLRVVVSQGTPPAVKQKVRAAVLRTPEGQGLAANRWAVVVEPSHQRPYTSHVTWSGVARRFHRLKDLDGHVCVIVLSRAEIVALKRALKLLERRAASARVVATFGMGGLPLLHWLATPSSGTALGSTSCYHLLAGLNWSSSQREKTAFKTWIASELATTGQVLVFDTGKEGNGIRQARDLALVAIEGCAPAPRATLSISGIVDGPSRVSERHTVRGANGVDVEVAVDYTRVPHLPTEDNGLLLGYDVDRQSGVIHPVAGLVLYRIEEAPTLIACADRAFDRLDTGRASWVGEMRKVVARCGARLTSHALVATSSGAGTISEMVRGRIQPAGNRRHKSEREWATAAMVLADGQETERKALKNALTAGLVSQPLLDTVVRRQRQVQQQLLSRHWSRERKRVVVL